MSHQLMDLLLTHWVNSLTLHEFVNNLSVPCCVVVLLREYFPQIHVQLWILG
jgi:hypothetical protein